MSSERPPKISGIMATHNGSRTIGETVDSILAQSLDDWELVIVDDCSTDDTHARLLEFSDPRIKVLRSTSNIGSGAARNWAVRESRGKYLAIIDDDDISHPDRFLIESSILDSNSGINMVSTVPIEFGQWGQRIMRSWPTETDNIARRIEKCKTPVLHPAAMLRRGSFDATGGYVESCRRAQDFTMMRHFRADEIINLAVPLLKYRIELPLKFDFVWRNMAYHDLAMRTANSPHPLADGDLRRYHWRVLLMSAVSWSRRNLHHFALGATSSDRKARFEAAEALWARRYS